VIVLHSITVVCPQLLTVGDSVVLFVFLFLKFCTVPLQCLWRDSVTLISTLLLNYLIWAEQSSLTSDLGTSWLGYELVWVRDGIGYELTWVRVGVGTRWYWVRVDLGTGWLGMTWFGYEMVFGTGWLGYGLTWVQVGLGTRWYWVRVDLGTSWLGYGLARYELVWVRVNWKAVYVVFGLSKRHLKWPCRVFWFCMSVPISCIWFNVVTCL